MTDSLTRRLARKWGADATVTELISSEGLIRNCKKTKALMAFDQAERPLGIQLFGARAEVMAEAAELAADLKPDFIDLNFGCPAKKVVAKNGGSSMLKNLTELANIIKLVVEAVNIPVTIKYRSGWDHDSIVAVEVARIAEDNGAAAVCLHPRTRMQGFSGEADWSLIRDIKRAINIPVIGSGDINSPRKAKEMFDRTGCDAVMICRASFGNPWIFKRTKHYLETGELLAVPAVDIRIDTALDHLRLSIEKYGSFAGLIRMRSKLCWYLKGLPGASKLRSGLVLLPTEDEIIELF
ncbi:MAG: tRNA dihydrouridine synthase DusB, partial [candidate division Zixibacteria bacterium]|nr:tRNA dihydrouridine synthase DusB [candidate division Zixibacteria bacterium]